MLNGYQGKILNIDLTNRIIKTETLSEEILRKYLGGSGLAAKILYEKTDEKTDPLGEENLLIFMTGPFTSTPVPTSGRHAIVGRSPLTKIWCECDVGGRWGTMLKRTGYDGLVIKGKASSPVYLWISEEKIEIRDASHLWGQDTYQVDSSLRKEAHPQSVIASIGPAGEKLVKLSSIFHDGRDARAAGRGGLGAVMGSKHLKAVVVYGHKKTPVAKKEELLASVRKIVPQMRKNTEFNRKYGTSGGLMNNEEVGDIPIQNWRKGKWEGVKRINGIEMARRFSVQSYYCGVCPIGCGRKIKLDKGSYAGLQGAGPEYETICCLGSNCLVDDLETLIKANDLCNRYGMDTISVGGVIGFSMEAYEKGLLSRQDCDGMEIKFGDEKILLKLIQQIGEGVSLGRLLGQGVREAAWQIGGKAKDFAIEVKGLELPAHDPRAYFSVAVGYATSNRGACHLQAYSHGFENSISIPELGYPEPLDRFAVQGKGILVAKLQNLMCLFDSLKLCKFSLGAGVRMTNIIEWLNYVTGWDIEQEEFLLIGERLFNLKRLYNIRCGMTRKDDVIPQRILTQPRREGGAPFSLPPLNKMLNEYYEYRDWDKEGIPTKKKIKELGLQTFLDSKENNIV